LNSRYQEKNGTLILPAKFVENQTNTDSFEIEILNDLLENSATKYIGLIDSFEVVTSNMKKIRFFYPTLFRTIQIVIEQDSQIYLVPIIKRYKFLSNNYTIRNNGCNSFQVHLDINEDFSYYKVFSNEKFRKRLFKLVWESEKIKFTKMRKKKYPLYSKIFELKIPTLN
jgi:hypothetical protein